MAFLRPVMRSCFALTLAVALWPASARADGPNDIDLRLFGDNVIEGWQGCRTGFWQSNRDPGENRFAYVFFAPIPDGEALPAWVKIGTQVIEIARVDIGSAETGRLEPFRLYRSHDEDLTVMMEIFSQKDTDDGIAVDDARLTFLMDDKFPFAVRTKGVHGCPSVAATDLVQPAASADTGLSLADPVPVDSLNQVPAPVMTAIANQAPDCAPESTAGFSTAYAINDDMMLWEIPCNLYARHASSVFVVGWTYSPDQASVASFPAPPGEGGAERVELIDVSVDPADASVTSVSLERDGDCGEYQRFQLTDAEGETVEFVLREIRRKTACDGIQDDPAGYPLVFQN